MDNNSDDDHLPDDMMAEILSRLPVKSLLRFRCVCNYWYTLTKTPTFITKNHHRKNNKTLLFLQHYSYQIGRYSFGLFPDILGSIPPVYLNLDEIEIDNYPDSVVGPMNGIFCLYGKFQDLMFLWNPALKEFRPVPVPSPNLPSYIVNFINLFGFGLDPKINSYKMVWIRHMWDDDIDCPYAPRVVSVYYLLTDCWRVFEAHLNPLRSIDNSLCNTTFVNGFYYWLTSEDFHNFRILSFDIITENLEELPGPPHIHASKKQTADLALYFGSISMILFDLEGYDNYYVEIWVMKEVGFWTNQLTMGPFEGVMKPLGFWEDGQAFFKVMSTTHFVLYNNDTQEIKDFGYYHDDGCMRIYMYKESLFSIKEGDSSFCVVQTQNHFEFDPPNILEWEGGIKE